MTPSQAQKPHQTLVRTARTGRFGVAYVRAIMASAGVGFDETSADEDVVGIDGKIAFRPGDVRLQVKASVNPRTNAAGEPVIPVEPRHWALWAQNRLPTYGVLVILEDCVDDAYWMDTSAAGVTQVPAAAYWARLNGPTVTQTSGMIVFPQSQRFTVDTVREIFDELQGGYGA